MPTGEAMWYARRVVEPIPWKTRPNGQLALKQYGVKRHDGQDWFVVLERQDARLRDCGMVAEGGF